MEKMILGIGDYGASKTPEDIIKTYALGSCIAVIVIDPKVRGMGMVHIALPESEIAPDKAKLKPGRFADTAIPALMKEMQKLGSAIVGSKVKLAGGANVADPNNTFNIGKRNAIAIKKALWAFGVGVVAEDIGGQISRTVSIDIKTGKITLSSPGRPDWKL